VRRIERVALFGVWAGDQREEQVCVGRDLRWVVVGWWLGGGWVDVWMCDLHWVDDAASFVLNVGRWFLC